MGPRQLLPKLLACYARQIKNQNSPRPPIGHVKILLHPLFWSATRRANTGLKLAAGVDRQIFYVFSPCVPCVSASHSPAFPVPLSQIWPAALLYNIYNAYLLKQSSIRVTSEMHFFPAKVGAKYALDPTQPPRTPNFQQISMVWI